MNDKGVVSSVFVCLMTWAIHKNRDMVDGAASRKAYMFNIIPHSSQLFQVHDKQLFVFLKHELEVGQ